MLAKISCVSIFGARLQNSWFGSQFITVWYWINICSKLYRVKLLKIIFFQHVQYWVLWILYQRSKNACSLCNLQIPAVCCLELNIHENSIRMSILMVFGFLPVSSAYIMKNCSVCRSLLDPCYKECAEGLDDDDSQQYSITEVIRHPSYKTGLRYHDLALLRLNDTVR